MPRKENEKKIIVRTKRCYVVVACRGYKCCDICTSAKQKFRGIMLLAGVLVLILR
ncbi:hypothetical protein P692DRAFT_20380802 [Suillus brevipes Sb2]|nr:hypothetical protein P692DRAFT_20380802 [Suillus brevipes Sb2]